MESRCAKLRAMHNVTDEQGCSTPCDELPCYEECNSHDPETLTIKEQEKYLAEILRDMSAHDLLKAIPIIENIVADHYMDKMFEMKAKDAEVMNR